MTVRTCLFWWIAIPLAAQTAIVDSHTSCLLGGWQSGKWADGRSLAPALKGERTYRVIDSGGADVMEARGGAPKPIEGPCGAGMEVTFDKELPEGSAAVYGSVTARKPESLPLNSRTYVSAFRALLDEKGVRSPVRIEQLLRVDVDGDGKLEVLASLYSVRKEGTVSFAGDYSMIVLRRVDAKDHLTSQVIDFEKHPREDGLTHMKLGPLVDLNGDGVAELMVRGEYAKGRYSHVYELRNGKFVRVLECTCGE